MPHTLKYRDCLSTIRSGSTPTRIFHCGLVQNFMLIGVDFDNTIVCYDEIFHRAAVERRLIPADLHASKEQIRDHCRKAGREEDWTLLQGHVYGVAIAEAPAFSGVVEFFAACRRSGIEAKIVSHRTQYPALGPQYDLHAAAETWLRANGILGPSSNGVGDINAYFETSRQAKLMRIADLGCDCFIDDLPELLGSADFPLGIRRILFDPHGTCPANAEFESVRSWSEAIQLLDLKERCDV